MDERLTTAVRVDIVDITCSSEGLHPLLAGSVGDLLSGFLVLLTGI